MTGYKQCAKCGRVLPWMKFHRTNATDPRPTRASCRECVNTALRLKRENDPKYHATRLAHERKYHQSGNGKAKRTAWNRSLLGAVASSKCRASQKEYAAKHGVKERLLTADEWDAILLRFDNSCAYCGKKGVTMSHDHVIPIKQGGKHEASNIVPACMSCNSRKKGRTPEEWGVPIRWPMAVA